MTRKELIAKILREHAVWTGNGDDYICTGCHYRAIGDRDATIDHRADMIDQAIADTEPDSE